MKSESEVSVGCMWQTRIWGSRWVTAFISLNICTAIDSSMSRLDCSDVLSPWCCFFSEEDAETFVKLFFILNHFLIQFNTWPDWMTFYWISVRVNIVSKWFSVCHSSPIALGVNNLMVLWEQLSISISWSV